MLARVALQTQSTFARGRTNRPLAPTRSDLSSAGIAFVAVAAVGVDGGGYAPRSWGWMLLAFASVFALALLLRDDVASGPLELASLAGLLGLAAWMFASGLWSIAGGEATREAERAVVYLAGLAAFIAIVEKQSIRMLLAGIVGATTTLALYGLGDRALHGPSQNPFEGSLLFQPLGYANALGILCAVGLVVAVGLGVGERRPYILLLLGTSAAPLVTALALTSSRGAWFSLACGLLALVVLRTARRRWTVVVAAVIGIALCIAVLTRTGFGNRPAYWRVALEDARTHVVVGSGAGTFDDFWYAHRPRALSVRDAHSLYVETLAELGPVGLVFLLAALLPPLAAAVAVRSNPAAVAAAGGYVTFLVHAGLDWDWEMPATTLAALACGAALLAAARPSPGSRSPERR